jgi:hypothetical protein
MRETLDIVTASLMQNIVRDPFFFFGLFGKRSFGALGVESPHGGAIGRADAAEPKPHGSIGQQINGPLVAPEVPSYLTPREYIKLTEEQRLDLCFIIDNHPAQLVGDDRFPADSHRRLLAL